MSAEDARLNAEQGARVREVGGCGYVIGTGATVCLYVDGHDESLPHSDFGDWSDETDEQRASFPYCAAAVALVDAEFPVATVPLDTSTRAFFLGHDMLAPARGDYPTDDTAAVQHGSNVLAGLLDAAAANGSTYDAEDLALAAAALDALDNFLSAC